VAVVIGGDARDHSLVKSRLLRREPAPSLPFEIMITAAARRYVLEHGARLFVWHARAGGPWIAEKAAVAAPSDVEGFAEYDAGAFRLMIERSIPLPRWFHFSRRRWPFPPIWVRSGDDLGEGIDVFVNPPGTRG
jgi:hypothetical protein